MASRNRFCWQYLQSLNALIFWFKYLQKVNAKCPKIWWKKKVLALWQITFDPLKRGLENIHQWSKTCFFHQKSEGILHLLFKGTEIRIWGHLYSAGIALQLYSALRFERLKRIQKSRAIPWDFWDKVFSLSMPSVCPRLTTV